MELSFLRGEFSDPWDSDEGRALLRYKEQLESLRDFLDSGVDYREITKKNIDEWEKELRGIIEGIKRLQNAPQIDTLLVSCEGAQSMIRRAINNLYIVSHILQKKQPSVKDMDTCYQRLTACPGFLSDAVDIYFKI